MCIEPTMNVEQILMRKIQINFDMIFICNFRIGFLFRLVSKIMRDICIESWHLCGEGIRMGGSIMSSTKMDNT